MTNLTDAFAQAAIDYRDRTALIDGKSRSYQFSQLHELVERYAAAWHARGVRSGDRVLIAMEIGADLYASLAALWSIGATVVLPEPAMGLSGVRTAIGATLPKFFCAAGPYMWLKLLPGLWRAKLLTPKQCSSTTAVEAKIDPDSIALISFTSGTTGTPKAIPRSHAFLMAQWRAVSPLLQSEKDEVDLVTFPVFVLINLAEGRTSVLPCWKMTKLSTLAPHSLVDWISVNRCTRALLPPALCEKLVEANDKGTLNHLFTGGGPVFPDVLQQLKEIDAKLKVSTVYGSTEAEPIAHADSIELGHGLFAGWPVDSVRLRIMDTEIQVAGDHVNSGYLDPARDTETKINENGTIWHRTGDAGWIDEKGRLWLLGRVGEQVITDKALLFPFAVEIEARTWPGVSRAALTAIDKNAVLVIEGDAVRIDIWRDEATAYGINDVRHILAMPLDKRHHSKVDRRALMSLL